MAGSENTPSSRTTLRSLGAISDSPFTFASSSKKVTNTVLATPVTTPTHSPGCEAKSSSSTKSRPYAHDLCETSKVREANQVGDVLELRTGPTGLRSSGCPSLCVSYNRSGLGAECNADYLMLGGIGL